MEDKFLDAVGEEAGVSVAAEASICVAFAELELALERTVGRCFIVCQFYTHD